MAWKLLEAERVVTTTVPSVPTPVEEEVSLNPSQDGYYDVGTGLWLEATIGLTAGETNQPPGSKASWIGMQFQLYTGDKPTWEAPGVGDPSPFILDLCANPLLSLSSGTLIAWIVPEVNPVPYSQTVIPFSRGEFDFNNVIGSLAYITPDSTVQNMELDYDILQPYLDHPDFTGKLSITFTWSLSTSRSYWSSSESLPVNTCPILRVTQTTVQDVPGDPTTEIVTAGAWDRFYTTGYDWRLPENAEQHQSETQTPGDLLIKPANLSLTPGELQVPAEREWTLETGMDDGWYLYGEIV